MSATPGKRLIIACCLALLAGAATAQEPEQYQRALYPEGMPVRHNEIAEVDEKAEFVLAADAALPNTKRHVIVYAERLSRDLPFDKIYSVFVALLEQQGQQWTVLDRSNVTEQMKLFVEFPGNFLDLRALVTPVVRSGSPLVAIELWATIHGTGAYTQADHLFAMVTPQGKLAPVLTLDGTYESGRMPGRKDASIATLYVGAADVVVSRREVEWNFEAETPPQCGPVSLSRYRLTGTKFEPVEPPNAVPRDGFMLLPRVDAEEKPVCGE